MYIKKYHYKNNVHRKISLQKFSICLYLCTADYAERHGYINGL